MKLKISGVVINEVESKRNRVHCHQRTSDADHTPHKFMHIFVGFSPLNMHSGGQLAVFDTKQWQVGLLANPLKTDVGVD